MEENLFRSIPRVDELLGRDELKVSALPPVLLRESVREELDALRDEVRGGLSALPETGILCARILARAEEKQLPTLRSVINATGVTLHTNLGRACLSERAANAAAEAARDYSMPVSARFPFTVISPASVRRSASRREQTPASLKYLFKRMVLSFQKSSFIKTRNCFFCFVLFYCSY